MGHVWWAPAIDLSLSELALAGSHGCHSDKQLHPQITAVIPPGIDQGLLFIQSLFISTELHAETVLLLAFCCGSLVHRRLPLASQHNMIICETPQPPSSMDKTWISLPASSYSTTNFKKRVFQKVIGHHFYGVSQRTERENKDGPFVNINYDLISQSFAKTIAVLAKTND